MSAPGRSQALIPEPFKGEGAPVSLEREALRQQMLLRALWRDARPGVLAGWTRDGARFERGLAAYRSNAAALAARALLAAFPTVAAVLGEEAFPRFARAFWWAEPPERGDIAQWGEALPGFIAADAQLASEPYLADVAQLDWAVHRAAGAADGDEQVSGLALLAEHEPERLHIGLRAGGRCIASPWPIVSIWAAHWSPPPGDGDPFAPVRGALAGRRGEVAWVCRAGPRVRVHSLADADARFMQALARGDTLAAALGAAGAGFDVERWLHQALREGWLQAVHLR
jgi:hypothetical protein